MSGEGWKLIENSIDSAAAPGAAGSVMVIAAHPDDETIGAGILLSRFRKLHPRALPTIYHVTDGAARDPKFFLGAGASSAEEYAAWRRAEAEEALVTAGIPASCRRSLEFTDGETGFQLAEMVEAIEAEMRILRPSVVLTHPYEGGHPDHDSVAFAVHAAAARLRAKDGAAPELVEFASYHDENGKFTTFSFLPPPAGASTGEPRVLRFDPVQRELKERMIACFKTQQSMLKHFPTELETFRPAPSYRFAQAPHPGPLLYQIHGFPGPTPEQWRERALGVQRSLGLGDAAI